MAQSQESARNHFPIRLMSSGKVSSRTTSSAAALRSTACADRSSPPQESISRSSSPSLRVRFYHSGRAHSDWAQVLFMQEIHGAGVAPWIRVWTRFVLDQVSLLDGSGKLFF
ncbi:MAG: hypothetical protein DWH84_01315 [Planctomycetota bacterium]|nr:MAG: hypothetical protein DWH84_01315 [Planctomycetota bacterium]